MCGICGIVKLKNEENTSPVAIKKMMGALNHRGPDSSGYFIDNKVAIGHTRLSIIDLQTGNQPLSNEDQTLWITFNGEIFNYVELREELILKGHIFKTKSDTETIIHSWEEWGPDCFNKFNGQWALALWDTQTKTLILSRDRLGIRPLYYTMTREKLLFASEIKSIFTDNSIPRAFNEEGLAHIFTFWSPVAPQTAFKDILELEPGNYAVIKSGTISSKAYWSIDFPERDIQRSDFNQKVEELKELLISAARLRFERSDVPVGAYLSGGIDSAITASIISKYTNTDLKTFSLRFEENEFDEGGYQNIMSKQLGTDHQNIMVSANDIGTIFPEVIKHTERPILRSAPAPLFLLSKLVRDSGYKVVVTGEGADEVLAGYDIFREAKVRKFIAENPDSEENMNLVQQLYPWMKRTPGKAPAFARSFFSRDLNIQDPGLSHRPRWNTSASITRLLSADYYSAIDSYNPPEWIINKLPETNRKWEDLSRAQWLEYKTLLSGYILSAQGDRMLMGNSIEGRFPFLDYRLVDFANKLPAEFKLSDLREKFILKEAFKNLIPDSILNRPKQPYRAPDVLSFFGGHKLDWIEEITNRDIIKEAGIFNHQSVELLISKCKKKKGSNMSNTDNMMTTALLSTMLVFKKFIHDAQPESLPAEPITIIDKLSPSASL